MIVGVLNNLHLISCWIVFFISFNIHLRCNIFSNNSLMLLQDTKDKVYFNSQDYDDDDHYDDVDDDD